MTAQVVHAAIPLSTLPAGFFGIPFALRYGSDISESASVVAASTLLGIVTMSGIIALTTSMRHHR